MVYRVDDNIDAQTAVRRYRLIHGAIQNHDNRLKVGSLTSRPQPDPRLAASWRLLPWGPTGRILARMCSSASLCGQPDGGRLVGTFAGDAVSGHVGAETRGAGRRGEDT
jgi:hypothetical protein